MSENHHEIRAQYMGLLPDWEEIRRQVKRLEQIDQILCDPSIQAPEYSCLECRFCCIIQDPDPFDDWNFDDLACYCSLLPKGEAQLKGTEGTLYATRQYPFHFIDAGLRPQQVIPRYFHPVIEQCPLNAPDRFQKKQDKID